MRLFPPYIVRNAQVFYSHEFLFHHNTEATSNGILADMGSLSYKVPGITEIEDASKRIEKIIHHTPVLSNSSINNITGASIFFKCENLQRGGAFKIRGASNAILSHTRENRIKGVTTHSSGNHAQAVAIVAKSLNIPAYMVMPSNTAAVKKQAVAGYGGDIVECEPTLQARESKVKEVIENTGALFIHPYNNYDIIAGQATACRELLEEIRDPDYILAPVGGGGLLSGTALSANYFSPGSSVIGCEPKGADDAFRSMQANRIIPSINPKTIADGLLTSLGEKTFDIIRNHVEEILTVEDELILAAMKLYWERMKLVVEPSGAITLAVILKEKQRFKNKRVAIIISGGNVQFPY